MREKVKNDCKRRATNRSSFSSWYAKWKMRKIFWGTQTGMRKIFRGTQNVRYVFGVLGRKLLSPQKISQPIFDLMLTLKFGLSLLCQRC